MEIERSQCTKENNWKSSRQTSIVLFNCKISNEEKQTKKAFKKWYSAKRSAKTEMFIGIAVCRSLRGTHSRLQWWDAKINLSVQARGDWPSAVIFFLLRFEARIANLARGGTPREIVLRLSMNARAAFCNSEQVPH